MLDIAFLNNAILTRNKLKNSLADLNSILSELKNSFKDLSDLDYSDELKIDLKPIVFDEYKSKNLILKQKEDEIGVKKYIKKMTVSNFLPKVTLEASYIKEDTNYEQNTMFLKDKTQDYYNYGLKIIIPLSINTFREIESTKLSYLIAKDELRDKQQEEKDFFDTISKKIKNYEKKIKIAKEDVELFDVLLSQTIEQRDNGLKTDDDVTVMRNSKKDSEFDIKIYEIEIKLLLNSLLAKVSG